MSSAPDRWRPDEGPRAENRLLTLVSNMFTNLNLTDMETCYKRFRAEVIQAITIQENGFGMEPPRR